LPDTEICRFAASTAVTTTAAFVFSFEEPLYESREAFSIPDQIPLAQVAWLIV
jgi:hypothetical protein